MKRKIYITVVLIGVLAAGGLYLLFNSDSVEAASDIISEKSLLLGLRVRRVGPEDLADTLGISQEELEEARSSAMESLIDQAVVLGFITIEQAEELKSEEVLSRVGLHRYLGLEEMAQLDYESFFFDALGVTAEEFKAAVATVQQEKLDDAVAEGKLTQEQADLITGWQALKENPKFNDTIKASYTAAIEEALEDGTITQAQSDALLDKLEDANFINLNRRLIPDRDRRGGWFPRMRMGEGDAQIMPFDRENGDG